MELSLREVSSGTGAAAVRTLALPAPAPRAAAPQLTDRIAVLDILRGLALLGMFAVHFNYYEATPLGVEPGRAAAFVERVIGLFVEERFYSIFGMLFGVGFAVQLERAAARGEPFVAKYLRRLAALAVFGFIAEGVFGYNVLFGYAMWGVPLLLVRRWKVKALVILLVICASSGSLMAIGRMAYYSRLPNGVTHVREQRQARLKAFMAAREANRAAGQSSSWKTVVASRIAFMPKFHRQWSVLPNSSFTLFLLGLIAFRLGLFHKTEDHRRMIASLMVAGGLCWLVGQFGFPFGGPPPAEPSADHPVLGTIATIARMNGFQLFRPQWLAFVYIGTILLLVARNQAWLQRLSALGWAGRMALTNYMMQVVLVDVLFTNHGLGMKVPALLVFPAAITLFVAQVLMSRWWLSRFRYGPLEWIWRSATNWRWQPLRIEAPVLATWLAA